MKIGMKKLLAIATALGGCAIGALFFSGPVLYSYTEPDSPVVDPAWCILNPLRARGPERAARSLLKELNAGNVREAFDSVSNVSPQVVAREEQYRLLSWKLLWRDDRADRTQLVYRVTREDDPSLKTPVRIAAVRDLSGAWQIESYRAIY